ncbi:beta-L-arabinofuranosidase domain-containing protein [Sphingomonas mollis]|uniref:Glycoside hydrolase family 127 protein n=1 Tax=Sphingomonas mollis TaxID=2795726 RepID=A0ABS0XPL5_9SPHN|nr:glycoside hydrolase family 127 protein [Sphingomonas sp. BT553]
MLAGPAAALTTIATSPPDRVRRVAAVPMRHVRLKPSPFADAFAANQRYLLSLDPERLLHNFYLSAGLPAPKPVYEGWEAQGIAGHSLGHWLSACALVVANIGNTDIASRLDHALAEMARIQTAHGDGYLGGTTVERDGKQVDGKIVFEEVRRGDIRTQGFDLNGGWVPLYTWHKVHAGLLDAHALAANPRALPIAIGLAGYLAGVLEPLSDAQMQQVLRAEHGGLNDSYAETHALTGNPRWLRMAEKIRHKAVLDPLTAQVDRLEGLHANTQIPKLIGLARLHELTGNPNHATAARFFHDRVTHHHSYVIGGNSEREHFGAPDKLAKRVTEATCEACNSYNMLKLTRHLYSWEPNARWFDYYERVQLNHILAHQRPDTGQFVYFMPLSAGARRSYSTAEESFWCCVGSGMESHAKHADSIYWHDIGAGAAHTLYVNLYVPSTLDWTDRKLALDLDTQMPMEGAATLTIRRAPRVEQAIALRLPGWAQEPTIALNDRTITPTIRDGYAIVSRIWKPGDRLRVTMPMALRTEALPDDPSMVAFMQGPLVLAADLGPASQPFDGLGPALVAEGAVTGALRTATGAHRFTARSALGEPLEFKPFFAQYDRRTAVYLPTFTPSDWASAKDGYLRAQAERQSLARRTVDVAYLGEMQPERDHGFTATRSETVQLNGRSARKLRGGETLTLTLARRPGPAMLQVVYWGQDIDKRFDISIDGTPLATETRPGPRKPGFVAVDYPLRSAGEQGKAQATISFTGKQGDIDIYEVRMLTVSAGATSPPPVA